MDVDAIRLFLLDLDGTIYLGDRLIDGAADFLAELRRRGVDHRFLTNNSSKSRADYAAKLRRLGVPADPRQILLSTDGVLAFLTERDVRDVYLVGTESMAEMFRASGIDTRSSDPRYVVLGYDTELTYEKIAAAAVYLHRGAELLASHPDRVCPSPDGPLPDVGAMLAMFETATGVRPAKVFGKPNAEMISHVLAETGCPPDRAAMVGDRLYTDMAVARNAGCRFILTLTGETKPGDLSGADGQPDRIVENVGQILIT